MANTGEEHLTGTRLLQVGLIGNPVAHSYSPRFQQAAFNALNIPARYELWHTLLDELPARVATLLAPECMGANITIPYKEAVLPLLDVVDPLATRIRAVNTIVHRNEYLYGYNTDAYGLLHALVEQGIGKYIDQDNITLRDYTAVLLGAGGAARSAAFALINASIKQLIIVNRNLERAQRLAAELRQDSEYPVFCLSEPDFLMPHSASLIINATPVGMHNAGEQESSESMSPLPPEVLARFAPDTFVFDMVYNPTETQLLCQARILGLRAVNGLTMLLHQGALAFTLWTGQPAPLEVMRAALL